MYILYSNRRSSFFSWMPGGKFVVYIAIYLSLSVQCKLVEGWVHAAEREALLNPEH